MIQPQFIMLTAGKTQWINISEITRAVVSGSNILLHLRSGDPELVIDRQDVLYVQAMLNSLAELPKQKGELPNNTQAD